MPSGKFGKAFAAIGATQQTGDQDENRETTAAGTAEEPSAAARGSIPGAAEPSIPEHSARAAGRRASTPPATRPPERRGPGRPPGKRSNPEYRQVTGLIRKETHVAVLKQMLDEGRSRDMGALIEELLERHYLRSKKRSDG